MRRLAVELRPKALDDFGLVPALERLAQTFTEQIGIDVDVEASLGETRLPPEVETALYRIVQEALTNVVKHARARHVSISLVRRASSVSAVIEDDGDRLRREPSKDGLGLIGMRERVELLDGRLEIESRPATGRRSSPRCPLVIRVLIVDDHAVVRTGLRLLLDAEDDIEVVGEAGNARDAVFEARSREARRRAASTSSCPAASGIDVTPQCSRRRRRRRCSSSRCRTTRATCAQAFAAGASGYVLKEAADTEVVAAVREVAAGGRYVHPALGARLVAAEAEERARAEADPLSDREREVLRLLALGHTNQEIAKMLYISVRTAETHRAHIMQKLAPHDPRRARALRARERAARASPRRPA